MGTWGSGPFDHDAAADFLDQLQAGPARVVTKVLRQIARTPLGTYIDVDDGGAAWAACELVALAFGHGSTAALSEAALDHAGRLAPREEQRRLAVDVLSRIGDRATSELAALWHEGAQGAQFDASLADLRTRLEAASSGPREGSKARTGDVIGLAAAAESVELVVVQVVGPGEVAVLAGVYPTDAAALEAVTTRSARRVPAPVHELLRQGRRLGNVPVRKDLKGKKLYADEAGGSAEYMLATASGGGVRIVAYDEACDCDLLRPHRAADIRAVALGTSPVRRVRSPEEREAELVARNAARWVARRDITTPDPFGDMASLESLVKWMEDYGVENAVRRFHDLAVGAAGYGRPSEDPERRSFAFAAIVAVWLKAWSLERWPAALAGRLPAAPNKQLMEQALRAARTLAGQVITLDAELRMIWEHGPDRGAELHATVASLQRALSSASVR